MDRLKELINRYQQSVDYLAQNWNVTTRHMEMGELREYKELCQIEDDTLVFLKELQHYKDLEEQGRLIVLPEKLVGHGDPVGEQGVEGKGQWIDNHCSVCGITPLGEEIWTHLDLDSPKFEYYMNYCPNCGAKMDEVE